MAPTVTLTSLPGLAEREELPPGASGLDGMQATLDALDGDNDTTTNQEAT